MEHDVADYGLMPPRRWIRHQNMFSQQIASMSVAQVFHVDTAPIHRRTVVTRAVATPKLFLNDSGLAGHLTGMSLRRARHPTAPVGPLVETPGSAPGRSQLCGQTIMKAAQMQGPLDPRPFADSGSQRAPTYSDVRRRQSNSSGKGGFRQHIRKNAVTSRDGGIRTRDLLLPKQAR
jgi:hypothetical protein